MNPTQNQQNGASLKHPTSDLPYHYRAYGFNLASDVPLVRLTPGTDPALDTMIVQRCGDLPEQPENATQIGPFLWCAPDYLSLDIVDVVHLVASGGKTLHYRPYPGIDDISVQLFLMGSGLGALLMQRKLLVMHGNAVEIDGACVMCVGPSGVGKSTTAAGLLQRGYRIMSDDICAIDTQNRIVPGMPHIKLWQEAAEGLGIETHDLDRVRPEMEKFGLPLKSAFCDDRVAIKTIFLLSGHHSNDITIETLKTHEKFMALRDNTYRLPFVAGMNLSALHFQQLNMLAKDVTVKRIKRPIDGFQVGALLDVLLTDLHGQTQGQS